MQRLNFEDFISCFRKQFIFQKGDPYGSSGKRISSYYTCYNQEQKLHNDTWAIICFIYTGVQYGFSDLEIMDELKIGRNKFEELKAEAFHVARPTFPDKYLQKKIMTKIGLVHNIILCTHFVRPKEIIMV